MEPQVDRRRLGRAPILGWTDGSPSISTAKPFLYPAAQHPSPSKSPGGSRQRLESSARSSSVTRCSEINSSDLSSTGREPATFPSVNSFLDNSPGGTVLENIGPRTVGDDPTVIPRLVVVENPVLCGGGRVAIANGKNDFPCNIDGKNRRKPKVPDGGWGWVIVAASFTISLIADGVSFSFGLLYREFLIHFGESKSTTAWIGSLFMSVPLISGPIGSALVDRFGCRAMTIVGGLVSALGYVLSAFADSVAVLYFTFGIVAGLGLGFCYVTAVVSISFWFDKKRGLATSLGACGTGVGTFVYAPMTQHFVEEYGWRGGLVLLAGTFLQLCVCGAVMRMPTGHEETSRMTADFVGTSAAVEEMRLEQRAALEALADTCAPTGEPGVSRSVVSLPLLFRHAETVPVDVLESQGRNQPLVSTMADRHLDDTCTLLRHTDCLKGPVHMSSASYRRPTAHHPGDVRLLKSSLMYRGAIFNLNRLRLRSSSCPDICRNSMTTAKEVKEKWYNDVVELLKDMADFSLFLELHFLLLSLSTVLLFVWFIVPYFYLVEYMAQYGYSEHDASALLSIIGITNFAGIVALGWAGDQHWMHVTKTYAGCLVLCGLAVVAMTLSTRHFPLLCASAASFGLFFASSFSFTPVILAQLSPVDRFTNAYGLILLCQGVGNLLGPPLAGLLFDVTQSWVLSFYMAGAWIVVSGLLIACIPATRNRHLGVVTAPPAHRHAP